MDGQKLKQLAKNATPITLGVGVVFFVAFGFAWWLLPLSILIGSATSFVTTTPGQKALEGVQHEKMLALKDAELDRQLESM